MFARIRPLAAAMTFAAAITVFTPATASAELWFDSQVYPTLAECVTWKNTFQFEYDIPVVPSGDRCYTRASGYYFKYLQEF